jgi:hypothetical protein
MPAHTCGQHVQHARHALVKSWHWLEAINIFMTLRWKLSNCKGSFCVAHHRRSASRCDYPAQIIH